MSTARCRVTLLLVLTALLTGGCTFNVPLFARYSELQEVTVERSDKFFEFNSIALINVDGYIGQLDTRGLRGVATSVADITQKLRLAENDGSVKAVLLRIHSPGGEVTASDMIYREIMRFRRESGKPVVVYMMGLAASGGYYVALAGDRIVAHPTCITGSVGVIMDFIDIEGLMKTFGVRHEAVKSGTMKNMGSPFRGLHPNEKDVLQGINRDMFERFMGLVRRHRDLSDEAAATISDGRIMTGDRARQLGLVDAVGDLHDALALARRLAGISTANVVAWRAFSHHNKNPYAGFAADAPAPKAMQDLVRALAGRTQPAFLYLWRP